MIDPTNLNQTNTIPQPDPPPPLTQRIPLAQIRDTGYQKLVNRTHQKAWDINYDLIVPAHPTVPVRAVDITIHQTLLNAVRALFAESGDTPFFVTSGYRSVNRQREIYQNATNRLYVMPPGHSEHNLGLAADILVTGIGMGDMAGTSEAAWLEENAWRHGMILRYTYGTTHITGVAFEPWHFRYVGQVHAYYITHNNLVLEEYLDFLQTTGGFTTTLNGRQYQVLYVFPQGDYPDQFLEIPQGMNFLISSSNIGGYVVTLW